MKGQVSTELLVIVGLILLIFIPLLVLVYVKANEANQQIASYQAELTVTRIASLANSVGSLGTETSVMTDVYLPPNTVNLTTVSSGSGQGGEIVLTVRTSDGDSPIADIIKYPIKNAGLVVDSSAAGGRIKVQIRSEYDGDQAKITIAQVK